MPNSTPLDALTPERLREIAARLKGAIGFLSVHGYNDEYLKNFVDAATLCEAVAKAQEWLGENEPTAGFTWDSSVDEGRIICVRFGDGVDYHPTLAAALGAVGGDYADPSK